MNSIVEYYKTKDLSILGESMDLLDSTSYELSLLEDMSDFSEFMEPYDEGVTDFIKGKFDVARDSIKKDGIWKSIIKLKDYLVKYVSNMWGSFTEGLKKYAGKIQKFVKTQYDKFKGKDTTTSLTVPFYQMTFDKNTGFTSKSERVKSFFLNNKFVQGIIGVVTGVVGFISTEIKNLVKVAKGIVGINTEATYTQADPSLGKHGRVLFTPGSVKVNVGGNDLFTSKIIDFSTIGKDAIDTDNKYLNSMDDVYYEAMLASEDIVKAYNDFVSLKFDKYVERGRKVLESREKFTKIVSSKPLKYLLAKVTHIGRKKYENAYNELAESVYNKEDLEDFGTVGDMLALLLASAEKSTDILGRPLTKESIIKAVMYDGYIWKSDDPQIIRECVQLRLNYNIKMRKMMSRIVKINSAFFKLSQAQAEILEKEIMDSKDGMGHKKFLRLVDSMAEKFIEKPGKMNFRKIGGGVVYYNKSDELTSTVARKPSSIIPLSMRYDYIIVTHGIDFIKKRKTWNCLPINIEGNTFINVNHAIQYTISIANQERETVLHRGNKPIKIYVLICNTTHYEKEAITDETQRMAKEGNCIVVAGTHNVLAFQSDDKAIKKSNLGWS